jgi:hypothetical protein
MPEETKAPVLDENRQNCTSEAVEGDGDLQFCCPVCGGEQLSYGVKSYQKAVICEDGELHIFGGDDFGEDDVDFACWNCRHIICVNGEPVRRVEEMAEWLKAQSAVGKG